MAKIKQSKNNGTFKITGLTCTHLEALSVLVNYTRLGTGIYEDAAFDLADAFSEFEASNSYAFEPNNCTLSVSFEETSPTINLVSKYD